MFVLHMYVGSGMPSSFKLNRIAMRNSVNESLNSFSYSRHKTKNPVILFDNVNLYTVSEKSSYCFVYLKYIRLLLCIFIYFNAFI